MPELGSTYKTLADFYKETENGEVTTRFINLMMQFNPILQDAVAVEANETTCHVSTQIIDLPQGQFRKYNQGVNVEKSTSKKVRDDMGMLETILKTDVDLAKLSKNEAAYRMREVKAAMSGMSNTMARNMFYSNSDIDDEKFKGLGPRYNTYGTDEGAASYNVINAGGSDNANTSMFMVTWDDTTCHTIYPAGSMAGLHHEDLGRKLTRDDNNKEFLAFVNHLKWDIGISLPNWKYSGRLANVDVASLKTIGQSGENAKNLEMLIIDLVDRRPDANTGKTVLYVNRDLHSAIRKQAVNKKGAYMNLQEYGGKKVLYFDDMEIKRCDGILSTEANVASA